MISFKFSVFRHMCDVQSEVVPDDAQLQKDL